MKMTPFGLGLLTVWLIGINLFFGVGIWVLVRGLPMPASLFTWGMLFTLATTFWWTLWSRVPLR
jgi:hypothetical protein